MVAQRNILKVFLASPSDLAEERTAVAEAVSSANRIVASRGWSIDLYEWEDAPPAPGRAQDAINPNVDECDVFLGLLWKRWGQPTGGGFSSGFEEEFSRAKERYLRTDEPQLWLAVRRIADAEREDPGPQLERVLWFREQVKSEVFYHEFVDAHDLRGRVPEWLVRHILEKGGRGPSEIETPTEAASVPAAPTAQPVSVRDERRGEVAGDQIRATLGNMAGVTAFLGSRSPKEKVEPPDEFGVARLYLLAATLMSNTQTSELLGVHEVNALYKHRARFQLTGAERTLLWRTLIGATYDNLPGWFWFPGLAGPDVGLRMTYSALYDRDIGVRKNALTLATDARLMLGPGDWEELVQAVLSQEEGSVRDAGIRYLAAVVPPERIPSLVEALRAQGPQSQSEVRRVLASLAVRMGPDRAMEEALAGEEDVSPTLEAIRKANTPIDAGLLTRATTDKRAPVREFAAMELARSGRMTREVAQRLTSDESYECRQAAYAGLVAMGDRYPSDEIRGKLSPSRTPRERGVGRALLLRGIRPDDIIAKMYDSYTYQELLPLVIWELPDGCIAYKALAVHHFGAFGDQVRSDLDNGFGKMEEAYYAGIEKQFGKTGIEAIRAQLNKNDLAGFIRRKFIDAALAGLAQNGTRQDAALARRHLTLPLPDYPGDVELHAVEALGRLGEASDVDFLVDLAKRQQGDLKRAAARAAIQLAPGLGGAARALVGLGDAEVFKEAVRALVRENTREVRGLLEPHLDSPNMVIREVVLGYLAGVCKDAEIVALLSAYPKGTTTYYNVGCWLDRLAYSPAPLREMYRQSIKARVGKVDEQG